MQRYEHYLPIIVRDVIVKELRYHKKQNKKQQHKNEKTKNKKKKKKKNNINFICSKSQATQRWHIVSSFSNTIHFRLHRKLAKLIDALLKARVLSFCGVSWWKKPQYQEVTANLEREITTLPHAGLQRWRVEVLSHELSRSYLDKSCFVYLLHNRLL